MSNSSPLGKFASTRWSLIASANEESPRRLEALSSLCEIYWLPVYAFIRRRGYQPDDAQDLTQDLFAGILQRDGIDANSRSVGPMFVDPENGDFRFKPGSTALEMGIAPFDMSKVGLRKE